MATQLTDNFTLEELYNSATAKARNIDNTPDEKAVTNLQTLATAILQPIRNRFGKPITINSGFRCSTLNKAVGGVSTSQHLTGGAADITSVDNKALWNLIVDMVNKGEIVVGQLIWEKGSKQYPQWIHLSIPSPKHHNQVLYLY